MKVRFPKLSSWFTLIHHFCKGYKLLNLQNSIYATTVFLTVFNYGNVIYGCVTTSTLKPLDAVYHITLRFITKKQLWDTPLSTVPKNWLSVHTVNEKRSALVFIIFKVFYFLSYFKQNFPPFFSTVLSWHVGSHCSQMQLTLQVQRLNRIKKQQKNQPSAAVPHILDAHQCHRVNFKI